MKKTGNGTENISNTRSKKRGSGQRLLKDFSQKDSSNLNEHLDEMKKKNELSRSIEDLKQTKIMTFSELVEAIKKKEQLQ